MDPFYESGKTQRNLDFLNKYKYFNIKIRVVFFLLGLCMNLCWNAVKFSLRYWVNHYGIDIWLVFLVCYNVPGLPILLYQIWKDDYYHRKYGIVYSYGIRLGVSYIILMVVAFLIPMMQFKVLMNGVSMVVMVSIIGIAAGAAHGWLYSFASLFSSNTTAYILVGDGVSTVLLIFWGILVAKCNLTKTMEFFVYYYPLAIINFIAIIFFLYVMRSVAMDMLVKPFRSDKSLNETNIQMEDEKANITLPQIMFISRSIFPSALASFLSLMSISMMTELIPQLKSSNGDDEMTTYCVYVVSVSGYLGSQISMFFNLKSQKKLLVVTLFFFSLFLYVVYYIYLSTWLNDIFILSVIGIMIMGNSWCFSVSYKTSYSSVKDDFTYQKLSSNIINVIVYIAIFLNLGISFIIQDIILKPIVNT